METALTINKTDLDAAIENVEESNKEVINEIINPTPVLVVDDTINLDKQLEFNSNDLERNFELSDQLQEKLDDLLIKMKENTQPFSGKSNIKTEDIYIDDNYSDNLQFFPKPPTDEMIEKILKQKLPEMIY